MNDQQLQWAKDASAAWSWAMGWAEEAKTGSHVPVKRIYEAAARYKERFCTDGLWSPGTEQAYNILREAVDMAQGEYENAQPPMES